MKSCASLIAFFLTMAVCTTAVQWLYSPKANDPAMIWAGLIIPLMALVIMQAAFTVQVERQKRERREAMMQAASRLPPEYLKAFQKEGSNGQPSATP